MSHFNAIVVSDHLNKLFVERECLMNPDSSVSVLTDDLPVPVGPMILEVIGSIKGLP